MSGAAPGSAGLAGSLVTRLAAAQWGKATSIFMAGGPLGSAVGPVAIAEEEGLGTWVTRGLDFAESLPPK